MIRPKKFWGAGGSLLFYGTDPVATGPVVGSAGTNQFRRIGEVGPGSYICWEEPPHVFWLEGAEGDTNSIYSINLAAGNVYYLRGSIHSGWTKVQSRVKRLNEEEGKRS
ncbi:MAG TPA: hypothetical protein VFM25_11455 [Verrucomicrobiae bacterium]|nr:hypothetical protein [Verrucomicrobiae bacterium]